MRLSQTGSAVFCPSVAVARPRGHNLHDARLAGRFAPHAGKPKGGGPAGHWYGSLSSPCLQPDRAIFDKTAFVAEVLHTCSRGQLEEFAASLGEDMARLCTAKKTLMSENYDKFIMVHEHLQKAGWRVQANF